MLANVVGGLAEEAGSAEAGVIDAFARLRLHDLDHGADDVALGVELAGVAGRVGSDTLEEVFVDFREHDDIGLVGEMQLVHLLHDPGEAHAAPAVVADVVEDAPEALGQRIVAQALLRVRAGELDPELAVDELQHLVGVVGVLGPGRPGIITGQAALVGFVVEGGLFSLRVSASSNALRKNSQASCST